MRRTTLAACLVALAVSAAPADDTPTVRQAAGANAAAIQAAVDQFRTDLGGADNGTSFGTVGGFRDVTWDDVPDELAWPVPIPGDWFDRVRTYGVAFTTPAGMFSVSADSSNPNLSTPRFGDLSADYAAEFAAFSGERLFTALQSNRITVTFRVPGGGTPASTRGFGLVFTDVDVAGNAGFDLFAGDRKLGSFDAPAAAGKGGLSFVGVSFPGAVITRAEIRCGERQPDVPDVTFAGGTQDVVVMDDMIFGEPVQAQGENTISEAALRVGDVRSLIEVKIAPVSAAKAATLTKSLNKAGAAIAKALLPDQTDKKKKTYAAQAQKALAAVEKSIRSVKFATGLDLATLRTIGIRLAEAQSALTAAFIDD